MSVPVRYFCFTLSSFANIPPGSVYVQRSVGTFQLWHSVMHHHLTVVVSFVACHPFSGDQIIQLVYPSSLQFRQFLMNAMIPLVKKLQFDGVLWGPAGCN
jgi:hypothetical protein